MLLAVACSILIRLARWPLWDAALTVIVSPFMVESAQHPVCAQDVTSSVSDFDLEI